MDKKTSAECTPTKPFVATFDTGDGIVHISFDDMGVTRLTYELFKQVVTTAGWEETDFYFEEIP